MDLKNTGLILEGGAMRGVYTSGVLDYFLEKDMHFNYVIGVSAGACQSFSYVSKQKGRSFKVNADFIRDPRYLSFRNYLKEKSIFGMDFMFDDIPKNLIPFDYEEFDNTAQKVVMVCTDCRSGKPAYFYNTDGQDMFLVCRASSSMPLLSPEVLIDGKYYLDGGISDPIPVKQSELDGNSKNVVVLTRNADYRKKPSAKTVWMLKKYYKDYPALAEAYDKRYQVYNDTLEYLIKAEKEGRAFIIRPTRPVTVKRTEKNLDKLKELYLQGLEDTSREYENLLRFLEN